MHEKTHHVGQVVSHKFIISNRIHMSTYLSTTRRLSLKSEPTQNAKQSSVFSLYGFAVLSIMALLVIIFPSHALADTFHYVEPVFTWQGEFSPAGYGYWTVTNAGANPYCFSNSDTAVPTVNVYRGVYPDTSTLVQTNTLGGSWCTLSVAMNTSSLITNAGSGHLDADYYWFEIHTVTHPGENYYSNFYMDARVATHALTPQAPITDTRTRFIEDTPNAGATVSSSSPVTVGAHIYINADDYESGMYLNLAFTSRAVQQLGGSVLDAWNSATGNAGIQIPITTSGDMTLSTTTHFVYDGSATGVYSIRKPTFFSKLWFIGVYFSPDTLISTSTTFIVGQKTSLDYFNEATTTNNLISTFLVGTSTPVISCDNVFSGGLGTCLLSLIIPTSDSLSIAFTDLKNNVLNRVPLGYITRTVTIFTDQSAVSLPALTYKFGSSSPQVLQDYTASDPVTFNPFSSTYYSSTSPLMTIRSDDGQNKNVWDIIDPFFVWLTIVGVFLAILEDLMGFTMATSSGRKTSMEGYKEFSDRDIKRALKKGEHEGENKVTIL
jgi:hypothetical protein